MDILDSLLQETDIYSTIYNEYNDTNIKNNNDKLKIHGEQCDNCSGLNIFNDNEKGIKVCTDCGTVIGNTSTTILEWRKYNDENGGKNDNKTSSFVNILLPQSSLGTTIEGRANSLVRKIRIWSAIPYKERKYMRVFKKIEKICSINNIPGFIELDSKILYKNVSEAKYIKKNDNDSIFILRGSNEIGLIAACVFYACKKNFCMYNVKQVADMFGIAKTKVTNGCKNFLKLIKLKNIPYDNNNNNPSFYFLKSLKQLNMEEYLDECILICNNINKLNITTQHTPLSVIAATILFVIDIHKLSISIKDVASIVSTSNITIEKTFNSIIRFKNILTDQEKVNKILTKLNNNKLYSIPADFVNSYNHISENIDNYIDNKEDVIILSDVRNYTKKLKLENMKKKQQYFEANKL